MESLVVALEDSGARVRLGAVQALGALEDPRAVEPLVAVLGDGNEGIRDAAVKALGSGHLIISIFTVTC